MSPTARWLVLAAAALGVSPAAAGTAGAAAARLVQATPAESHDKLRQPFTDAARSDWHYTPRRRAGIAWKEMSAAQREATTALLRSALTERGLDKVRAVMALETVLREIETFPFSRDPENYAVAIFGDAGDITRGWGWRIEGHHLSLHFTLRGDTVVATLPQFFGANPATLPRDFAAAGLVKGHRVLGAEEDGARALLDSLDATQRAAALIDARPNGDIVSRNEPRAATPEPRGVAFAALSAAQQARLLALVSAFAEHLQPDLAAARLARVRAGGLETIRFAWAGGTERGRPFYFRIQGAGFMVEFDNSGGNHVHSVWRDFTGDWGRDMLSEHYRDPAGHHRPAGR